MNATKIPTATPPAGGTAPQLVPVELDRDSKNPRWMQVRDDVARRIDAGRFSDGFPGEHALREQYGVSRQTIRMALRSLRETGVISAARGQEPKLLRPQIEQPLGTLYSLFASVEQAGMTQESIVLNLDERRDARAAGRLGLEEEAPLVFLHRVRLADGEPLALDQIWLPAAIARPLLKADFRHTALYSELADTCGVRPSGGFEEIDAITL
ncbi:MAG: GntR family transcriptional regulator, partial [Aeromicrobium sp.]